MPLPTIANVYRVALEWKVDFVSLAATNVIHVLAPGADEEYIFNAMNAAATVDMWNLLGNDAKVREIVVTKLDGTPDGRVFPIATADQNRWKGAGGDAYIPQACALVKETTAATGRSGRGRIFLPFLAEGQMEQGNVREANRTGCQAAWIAFANALVTANSPLAVASYLNSTASQVLAVTVEHASATQRRRWKRT